MASPSETSQSRFLGDDPLWLNRLGSWSLRRLVKTESHEANYPRKAKSEISYPLFAQIPSIQLDAVD